MKELGIIYLIVIAALIVVGFAGYRALERHIIDPLNKVNAQIQSMQVK